MVESQPHFQWCHGNKKESLPWPQSTLYWPNTRGSQRAGDHLVQCVWFTFPGHRVGWRGVKSAFWRGKIPILIMTGDGLSCPWKVVWQRYLELLEYPCTPQISPCAKGGHVTISENWIVSGSGTCYLWVEAFKGEHLTLWLSPPLFW